MSSLSPILGQHFAYASGRTGVLQQLLLTASDRDRLLGARDLQGAEQILTEIKLTNNIDQGVKKADEILLAVGKWIREEVEKMAPESKRSVFHILWLQQDAPQISYLLKEHRGLTSAVARKPQSGMTAYDVEDITAASLPADLKEFVQGIINKSDLSARDIDGAVAQFVADLQRKLARESGSTAIKTYVRHVIDLDNIRTALRLLREGGAEETPFITGGGIPPKHLSGDLKKILSAIDNAGLSYELSEAVRKAHDDPNALEQALASVVAHDIAHMWNIPLSIEPIFAFGALAQSQLKLIRALIIGKRAALTPQEIKKMLPPFLPASHYVL